MRISRACATAVPFLLAAAITACGSASSASPIVGSASSPPTQLTLYTSVTQDTVTAVLNGFEKLHPGVKVSVFRATTGQLNARIAADQHSGGPRADVIWGTDPLSMESYAQDSLFQPWPLPNLTGVPPQDKTTYFWGTRELYLVIVAHKGLTPMPASWADLTSPAYKGKVALPDPAAAGSAFAALGYFATEPGFSMSFYDQLKANGAVQVSTIPEVVTDVAEGRYQLGITLDSEVRAAIKEGSPVVLDWPADGAIGLYSPIAETTAAKGAEGTAAQELAARADPALERRRARRARAAGPCCARSRCRCCGSRCSPRPRWSSSPRRAVSPSPRCSARRPALPPCRRWSTTTSPCPHLRPPSPASPWWPWRWSCSCSWR
jgi:iron(III) transport system substrate-binding protein